MSITTIRNLGVGMAVALALGGIVGACGGGSDEAGSSTTEAQSTGGGGGGGGAGDAAAGKTLYASSCASCHGPDATGITKLGKNLTTSAFLAGLSDEEAVAFVKKGRPASDPANTTGVDMPAKGGNPSLNDEKLADIIAYLRTLEQ